MTVALEGYADVDSIDVSDGGFLTTNRRPIRSSQSLRIIDFQPFSL